MTPFLIGYLSFGFLIALFCCIGSCQRGNTLSSVDAILFVAVTAAWPLWLMWDIHTGAAELERKQRDRQIKGKNPTDFTRN